MSKPMSNPNSGSGFTLIELVMVLVILGALSAFALLRFADLSGDARQAKIEAAYGAMRSAVSIVSMACSRRTGEMVTLSSIRYSVIGKA